MEIADRGGAGDFTSLAKLILVTDGRMGEVRRRVDDGERLPPRVERLVKAAVAAGTTIEGSWGAALGTDAAIASRVFLEGLRTSSVFDRILPDMVQLPLRTRLVASTLAITGGEVGEASAKPVFALSLAGSQLLERKAAALLVLSAELAESASAAGLAFFANELRRGVSAATDAAFFADMLDSGSPPIGASAGSDAAAMRADLSELLAAVHRRGGAKLTWILGIGAGSGAAILDERGEMSPTGGVLMGLPAVVSDVIAPDDVLLLNAAEIAASGGTVLLDAAKHASVEMNDAPSGEGQLTSLWQTNCRGLKAERRFGFERLQPEAAALMTNVGWAAA